MKLICGLLLIVFCLTLAETNVLQSAEPVIIYADDFANVRGYRMTNTEGRVQELAGSPSRLVSVFMSDQRKGEIALVVWENHFTPGFDGKPGVLSLGYEQVPEESFYSGFAYQGRIASPIKLTCFQSELTKQQLD